MIVECPACTTIFPVDPKKVPAGGVHARCSVCSEVFFVSVPGVEADLPEPEELGAPDDGSLEQTDTTLEESDSAFEEPGSTLDEVDATYEEVDAAFEEPGSFEEGEATYEEPEASFEKPGSFEGDEGPYQEPEASFGEPGSFEEDGASFEAPGMATVEDVDEGPGAQPLFGKRDPLEKAQRLARVLVSDIILYNPDRHHMASESGRVKEEFGEEIQKSWNEYVEQVGEDLANSTNFFNDALNEILAKGEQIF